MSLQRLDEIVKKAAKALYDNDKYMINVLAVKARKTAEAYPTDQTALGMSAFLNKKAAANQTLITRAELKDVYNRLYTRNTKFAESFSEELGIVAAEDIKHKGFSRDPLEGISLTEETYNKFADPILSNALASAFDKTIPYKPFSNKMEKSAQENCLRELNRYDIKPKQIDIVAGQEDILICQASYETPRGTSNVLIPIEIKNNKALFPTMFLSTAGFRDLKNENLQEHLLNTAGKKYTVNVQELLKTIAEAKNGQSEVISDLEYIITKAAASKEIPASHMTGGILQQEIDKEAMADVKEFEYEQPAEVQEFAKKLTSNAGIAEFTLGKVNVDLGRKIISQAMNLFGYKNAQIGISNNTEDTIFYAVAVDNTIGFNVPVKIVNKKISYPTVVFADGRMVEFSKEGISELLAAGETDHNATVVASTMFGFSPSDLVKQIKIALHNGNYVKAEEGLNVLNSTGDKKAYKIGYELYVEALKNGGMKKVASVHEGCTHQYKSASSKYMLCAQTNLPIHKIYKDKNGQCRPGYRQNMDESSEGNSSINSKIFQE